jgi:hypothetical protein
LSIDESGRIVATITALLEQPAKASDKRIFAMKSG